MKKQLVIIGIVALLGCISLSGCSNNNQHPNGPLYVGYGSDADYRTIQEAVNAAENNATIIIKSGTYNEVLVINKTITLIGEDKNTAVIDFNPDYAISQVPIITINADNCSIENLQITLSNNTILAQGISINSNYNTIKNTIITNVSNAIELSAQSISNTIIYNEIKNNQIGIVTSNSNNNNISHNTFSNTNFNIYLSASSDYNNISFNTMKNSIYGIRIFGSEYNNVYKNCITNNKVGLYCCCDSKSNRIYSNTLLNNSVRNAEEYEGLTNIWYNYPNGTGNYWDDYTGSDENHDGIGDTPYKIYNSGNQDIHPLMIPPIAAPCNQ
jgi:parallel beta-helix repeat protein